MGIGPRIDGPKVHDLKCAAGYYEAEKVEAKLEVIIKGV
jgi:hypothetical protein